MVSFRGTFDPENYFHDLIFYQLPFYKCNACYVHAGFLQTYNSIADELVAYVKELKEKNPEAGLFITGHSLGGGMTTIAAVDLYSFGIKATTLVTMESPRIGNK